jgi:hypothetical protein
MINQLVESRVQCPYCWERFTLLVDASIEQQEYVEDCEVCCRPIDFVIEIDDKGTVAIEARLQHE